MRFSIPRSASPSPERVIVRPDPSKRPVYGLRDEDLYDLDDDDSDIDSDISNDDSDDSLVNLDDPEETAFLDGQNQDEYNPNPHNLPRTPAQQNAINESLRSIRQHVTYVDPYEEWHKKVIAESERDAKARHLSRLKSLNADKVSRANRTQQSRNLDQQKEIDDLQATLASINLSRDREIKILQNDFDLRVKKLWEGVQRVLKKEEEEKARKNEELRKKREEEEERVRKEQKEKEERRRKEQEAKEREERRVAEERAELERQRLARRQQEEQEVREREERERQERERTAEAERRRQQAGAAPSPPTDDDIATGEQPPPYQVSSSFSLQASKQEYETALQTLTRLKTQVHPGIKANPGLKSTRNRLRRQITPKLGQLTSDSGVISRVTQELTNILLPTPPHEELLFAALLSALAKSFLLQAEAEVSAKPDTALPLARVLATLLSTPRLNKPLSAILIARLLQRTGPYAIPFPSPTTTPISPYIKSIPEDPEKRASRIGGITTLVFATFHTTPHLGTKEMCDNVVNEWKLGRFWIYVARLLSNNRSILVGNAVGLEIIFTALSVAGDQALRVWGKQWVKVLKLIYTQCDDDAAAGKPPGWLLGGDSQESKPRRVRIREEIRKVLPGIS